MINIKQASLAKVNKPKVPVGTKLKKAKIPSYILLGIFTVIFLVPVLWAFMSSFKTTAEIDASPFTFPSKLYLDNFVRAWSKASMGSYFLNSLMTTGLGLVFLLVLGIPCAYVLSRFSFRGRTLVAGLFMAGLFVNVNFIITPIFLVFNGLGKSLFNNGMTLTNNRVIVALVNAVTSLPFSIYLMSGFLKTLPKGYEEAAKIDGCGYWGTLIKIVAPLALPSIMTVILFNFLNYWNEYLVSLTFLQGANRTLPVGLLTLMRQAKIATDFGAMYAGLVIVMLPVLIVYIFVQGQLTKGMTVGGLKG